jgi:hypothetical protein
MYQRMSIKAGISNLEELASATVPGNNADKRPCLIIFVFASAYPFPFYIDL